MKHASAAVVPIAGPLSERALESLRSAGWALAYLAECQLATLEELNGRRRTSKTDLARHGRIARFAVEAARRHCGPGDLEGCPRLDRALNEKGPAHGRFE